MPSTGSGKSLRVSTDMATGNASECSAPENTAVSAEPGAMGRKLACTTRQNFSCHSASADRPSTMWATRGSSSAPETFSAPGVRSDAGSTRPTGDFRSAGSTLREADDAAPPAALVAARAPALAYRAGSFTAPEGVVRS